MAIAKFQKVVSLFKTTLAQRITDSATSVTLSDAPGGVMQYPAWMVVEPLGENVEIIYLPSAPSSTTYSSVVRGLDPESDNDTNAGFEHDHPAGVDVIISPIHRNWNELVKVMDGDAGTGATILRIGDETDSNITVYAQNADGSKPYFQYNAASNKWLISNDGTSTYDISAGGSGLTRGPGVDVVASAITLDVRASGGLRNNQGTGSQQADVDPTIVARLDTGNVWGAVQSFTANNAQITTDADSANDAVRSSYLDAQLTAKIMLGAVAGTSGEAISIGDGVYLKASDSKYYKAQGTGDESTFSFAGIALTAAGGADVSFSFSPPGHVVTTSGLTAGAVYYITDTAGTLGTTPGTRYARVARANSTTQLQVLEPKFIRSGSFSYVYTDASPLPAQTCGFRPAKITFRAVGDAAGAISVGESQNGTESCVGYAASYAAETNASAWYLRNSSGPTSTSGAAGALSSTGFTPTHSSSGNGGTYQIYWTAESL